MKNIITYLCVVFVLLLMFVGNANAQTEVSQVPTSADTTQWNYVLPYEVYQSLSDGNAVLLSAHFNSMVEVSMPQGGANVYSKKQAEVVMSKFFSIVHNPHFVVEHEQSMSASTMTIGSLSCDGGVYKTYILTQPNNGQVVIHQIKVERFDH